MSITTGILQRKFVSNYARKDIEETFQENVRFESQGSIKVPSGDISQRPPLTEGGHIRYNDELEIYEGIRKGKWENLSNGNEYFVREVLIEADPGVGTFDISYEIGTVFHIYVNGFKLPESEFTADNGTSIVLSAPLSIASIVNILTYTNAQLVDTYSKKEIDKKFADLRTELGL